jgi:proteasome-associated ATPase
VTPGSSPSPYGIQADLERLQQDNYMLREDLRRARSELDAIRSGGSPRIIATIIGWNQAKRKLRIILRQHVTEIAVSPDAPFIHKLEVGASLELAEDGSIVSVTEPLGAGALCTVTQIVSSELAEVQWDSYTRLVYVLPGMVVKPGDRGLLDPACFVLMRNFGSKSTQRALGDVMIPTTFEDIGGQEEAKRALYEALIAPYEDRALYSRFNMKPSKGVILWGPPGTGKTMLARALAAALAELHGAKALTSGFHYIKGPELLSKYLGETEANIRRVFGAARDHFEEHHYPAVIFVDECDALLGRRGMMGPGWEGVDRTVVPQFLSEMDGMRESTAFVLLATNRPDILDPGVTREGRIDRKVHVQRPKHDDAMHIFALLFKKKPLGEERQSFAKYAADELYSDSRQLWNVTTEKKTIVPIYLRTIASGAMVAGLVERAAQHAIRDRADAIERQHVDRALTDLEDEQRRITHDLNDFMDALDGAIVSVDKVTKDTKDA